ncbi:sulfotransferase 1B1-like [Ylistrum balloti]|uniref:sulfotransferase 1B1-like n=1 Tax=Ylistrum balloti TaxID=509963 RepID=UPI002905DF11|nr:sulfotransferase 1B1-like [Ylistrum balloti]
MEILQTEDRGGEVIIDKYYDGIRFPANIPGNVKDQLVSVKNLKHTKGDVFLDTFPKTGTHWAYEILYMLQTGKAEYSSDPFMCLEFQATDRLDAFEGPRVLKSHLYPQHIPKFVEDGKCKVVYIYRNPKDTAVSLYSFIKRVNVNGLKGYNGTWEHFFEIFATKPMHYNSWFEHVKAWLDFKKENAEIPILMVSYEDMKKDLRSCVKKMAEHLDVKRNPEFLDEVANKCQFNVMSKAQRSNVKETTLSKDGSNPFYRKGGVGDWKNWLTVAQNEMYDAMLQEKMADIDLEIKYTL